jgi:hypothetical protein
MTVLIYVDTSKSVGDPDQLKVFANPDAAERNSLPVTNRARTSSPRREVLAQTRRTEPQVVNATAKISGTTRAPTSRQRPLAETVRIKHSIQGASGSTMRKPDQFSSISSAASRLEAIRNCRAVALTKL